MQVNQDARGNYYTDLIRVPESIQDRNQSRRGVTSPGSNIHTLDRRVEQFDFSRRSFEIRDQSRERIIVSLPSNAERSEVDHFQELRDSDYVRVEGRFIDRQRSELAIFPLLEPMKGKLCEILSEITINTLVRLQPAARWRVLQRAQAYREEKPSNLGAGFRQQAF